MVLNLLRHSKFLLLLSSIFCAFLAYISLYYFLDTSEIDTMCQTHVNVNALARDVLPTNIVVSNYDLSLTPDLKTFTFEGTAIIKIKVVEPTNSIILNQNTLTFQAAHVLFQEGEKLEASNILIDTSNERVTFEFPPDSLTKGLNLELHIDYTGIINDQMNGFYRSSYTDANGDTKWMGTTQFEATDARKAFPCIDEPNRKATFNVTLNVEPHFVAVSNMNEISSKMVKKTLTNGEVRELKEVKFAPTPVMSTYILAFVVGELETIEGHTTKTANPIQVRVLAPPGQASEGHFGLNCAIKILEYFESIFGIPYPLPKMDLVAVPDFDAGAMENWGLVTYRLIYLLFDEKKSSSKAKQQVAYVVGHELAHQWFGNLVTMDWWSELWLNEGFATWVGWLAVDHLFPEWDIWTNFLNEEQMRGLSLDSLRSSHPIEVDVKHPSEINQIFDIISYSKGASLIRMLSSWMGVDVFLKGIRSYLKKHQYSNARTADLWAALSEACGTNVEEFMQTWTRKIGYPLINVEEVDQNGSPHLKLTQQRYLSTNDVKPEDDLELWWVPLNIQTSKVLSSKDVLNLKEAIIPLPGYENVKTTWETLYKDPNFFYKLNAQQTSFYVTSYPSHLLNRLGMLIHQQLEGKHSVVLSTPDRVGLLYEVFALAVSGKGSTVDALKFISRFENEHEYIVWNEISNSLEKLSSVWYREPDSIVNSINEFTRKLFAKKVRSVGWVPEDGESDLRGLLRLLVIRMAGLAGDEGVIKEAKERFSKFVNGDENSIHPNLRSSVYKIVVKTGGSKEFEQMKFLYNNTKTVDQKLAALATLGITQDKALIQQCMVFALSEHVRHQDIIYLLGTLSSNPAARHETWEFVKKNFDHFCSVYSSSLGLLGRVVSNSIELFSSNDMLEDVTTFFENRDTKKYKRPLDQSMEKVGIRISWLNRERENINKWISGL